MPRKPIETSEEIERIHRRMAQLRLELHQDVIGAVDNAQTLIDWTMPIRSHPWISFGVALAAGFLVVPKSKPPVSPDTEKLADRVPDWVPLFGEDRAAERQPVKKAGLGLNLASGLINFIKPIAFNMARNYAFQELERYLAQGLFGPQRFPDQDDGETDPKSEQGRRADASSRFRDTGL